MGKLFDMNNPFWSFLGRLVDVFILHVIWLICCLPIFTIGPATTALYYAMMKDVSEEDPHYIKSFFRSFKLNFKQGIGLGLLYLVAGLLIGYSIYSYYALEVEGTLWTILKTMSISLAVVYLFSLTYIFPVLARFDNTNKNLIKNSLFLAIKNFGWTILMIIILGAVGVGAIFFPPLILLGFGFVVMIDSYILNHIFKPIIEKINGKTEEKNPDEWVIPEEEMTKVGVGENTKMRVRTRFAPSPTGRMHVGNLRTALYAYLITKHEGGDYLLRIEDTDQERYVEGAVDIIYRTMQKTGLIHDEGPDKPGNCGPYVQSDRQKAGIYMDYAKQLIEKGEAYYCFCDEERLNTLKTTVGEDGKEIRIYDKHCLSLSKEEIEANLAAGKPFVIRQNNPTTGTTTFHDEIYGDITVENSELDDMVLIKSDGFPTYNFANVVDDHLMGITHVVRGNEYLSSSPKYNRLYEAFGWEVPVYVHCPLITDETHKKLSKRSGHSSFEDLIEQGFLTEAVVNFVALLGWSPEDNQEIMSMDELIKKFDYTHINKSPAVFDYTKLKWMNGEYIKKMDDAAYLERALPEVKAVIQKDINLEKIALMVKSRIEVFTDIKEMIGFFEEVPEYDNALYENKKAKVTQENALETLKDVLPILENQEDFSNDALFQVLSAYGQEKEYKTNFIMWPIRTAVSGLQMTPGGATELMDVLGKEESIKRIKAAIEKLS